ncbi:MAG TPA: SCO family protein [Polyangia bacterium]|jgi:protein SCO1/2|nr:SCO family protein [Polyangia bacterium]
MVVLLPLLALLSLSLAMPGCAHDAGQPAREVNASGSARPSSSFPLSSSGGGPSLFSHPWSWTDEHGQAVTLARWRGQPLVVTAMFTQCKATCPRTLAKLRRVQDDFHRAGRTAEFVLVTLDPDNDTPQALLRFKSSAGLPDSWHLLSGSLTDTRNLRDLLGIHVIDDGPHLLHDGRIVVFDGDGRPARAFEGYALDSEVRL